MSGSLINTVEMLDAELKRAQTQVCQNEIHSVILECAGQPRFSNERIKSALIIARMARKWEKRNR